MKLEVGMYVRTPKGIAKIETIEEDRTEIYFNCDTGLSISFIKKDFTHEEMAEHYNHSYELMDLIETGDILEINNEKYEVIYDESFEKLGILIPSRKELSIRHSALEYVFKKYNVSIITKEQFESIYTDIQELLGILVSICRTSGARK